MVDMITVEDPLGRGNRMTTAKQALREKRQAHHLWNATSEDGKINITRNKAEKEDWDETMEKKSMRRSASMDKTAAKEMAQSYWALFGASLVDDPALVSEIPKSVVRSFNANVNVAPAPEVPTWEQINQKFGESIIKEIRASIADGMKVRLASKSWNLPFVVTKDVMVALPNVQREHIKAMVDSIRSGNMESASRTYGEDFVKVAKIYRMAQKTGMHKLSIDNSAKSVIEDYFGPYGEELCKSISKRVRADLAQKWLSKHAVDSTAAEYWSKYFGAYGEKWTSFIPKVLRPSK